MYISRVRGTAEGGGAEGRLGDDAMQDGWEERRATGASHSHALLYYAFLRFFSPLLSSLVVPLRTFRFSSSSSSVFANARPSFPSPFHPPILLMSLAACAVVNISPRQVDRRGSNLLCDSLHTRAPSAFAASRVSSLESRREKTRKKPAGPERRTLLRMGDAISRKLRLQLDVCRQNCEGEGR